MFFSGYIFCIKFRVIINIFEAIAKIMEDNVTVNISMSTCNILITLAVKNNKAMTISY